MGSARLARRGRAVAEPVAAPAQAAATTFAYTDFGTPGTVVADTVEPRTGIRKVRFANGVRLNLKQTALEDDRVRFVLDLDGGDLLATRDKPLATAMASKLPAGGLGKHSQDELTSLLAGHSVSVNFASGGDRFVSSGITTPRDLELQLDLLAAALTDPGYRKQGEVQYRREISNWFKRKDATPGGALGSALGGILSDNDPRFTVQPPADYQKLSFAKLRKAIGGRLAHGAIELALVGDIDPAQAIALVGKTLGALPAREPAFVPREDARARTFTADRTPRTVAHTGEANQALLQLTWPTTDDTDPVLVERLELLERVVRIELADEIREKLGKAYSPGASSAPSHVWRGFGTFTVSAGVDVADVAQCVPYARDRRVHVDVTLDRCHATSAVCSPPPAWARAARRDSARNDLPTDGSAHLGALSDASDGIAWVSGRSWRRPHASPARRLGGRHTFAVCSGCREVLRGSPSFWAALRAAPCIASANTRRLCHFWRFKRRFHTTVASMNGLSGTWRNALHDRADALTSLSRACSQPSRTYGGEHEEQRRSDSHR